MADDDTVTIKSPTEQEKTVPREALPFFVNQGWVVLTADGRQNTKATNAAAGGADKKEH